MPPRGAASSRDAFVRLAQAGLLTAEQATALGGWAGMRELGAQDRGFGV